MHVNEVFHTQKQEISASYLCLDRHGDPDRSSQIGENPFI